MDVEFLGATTAVGSFHSHGGYPKMDGLLFPWKIRTSHLKMDENWGYPHDLGNHQIETLDCQRNKRSMFKIGVDFDFNNSIRCNITSSNQRLKAASYQPYTHQFILCQQGSVVI